MPVKIKTPSGDQNFSSSNFEMGTSIPVFLTPDKPKYLIVGANLEAFSFSGSHPDFEVETVYSGIPIYWHQFINQRIDSPNHFSFSFSVNLLYEHTGRETECVTADHQF